MQQNAAMSERSGAEQAHNFLAHGVIQREQASAGRASQQVPLRGTNESLAIAGEQDLAGSIRQELRDGVRAAQA